MRGELDELTTSGQGSGGGDEAQPPARPPGGKALLRLLAILERDGLDSEAAESVGMAVPDEDRGGVVSLLEGMTASPFDAPLGERLAAIPGIPGEVAPEADSDGARLAEAIAAAVTDLGPPTATGPQWRSLGPWTIPNGQTYGSSRVNVSGRVACVAVDPSDAAHVLVGAAQGGVWESRNRGGAWAPRSDFAETLAVGAIAFDQRNPRVVYCGLGEGNFYWWMGRGILRSTDGGASWSTLCTAPFVGQGFHTLHVDANDSQHLVAGTTHGLYVSNDGGVTWTRRRSARTWSVSWAPTGGAAAEILAGCSDGVWRSTDGGATWAAQSLPGAPSSWDRLEVSIAPSRPATAYAWGSQGGTPRLYRRAGRGWSAIGTPPGVNVNQAWYDWFVAAAPDNADQVYCGAIDVHRGTLAGGSWTWLDISSRSSGQSIHPDQHAIAFEPGNPASLYVGNDGGLFRSPDRGVTWQHCNNGLVISEFEYLAQDVGSSRWLLGGTQDNGTQRWTGSSTMEHVADGDGGDCGVNRVNPNIAFHTYYGMSPERSSSKANWGSWTAIRPPVPTGEGSLFYPPFETSATTGDTIAMGGDALYVSRNNGTSWTRLTFPSASRASALAIPGPDEVYVGTTKGAILRTRWSGSSWSALSTLGTPRANAYVSDLHARSGSSRLWATSSTVGGGRVFRSDNGGSTWTDVSAGLPTLPVNAVEVDPGNQNRVWVGADVGVYQSFDAGGTWSAFSSSLPNAMVGDLVFHPHARVLRAGTRNRGIWEIPVDGWQTQPWNGVQFSGNLGPNASGRWFTFNWPATWHVVWTVMPVTVRSGAPQVSWTVQVERASAEYVTYWITVKNLTASAVSFEGRFSVLSRY